MEKAGKMHMHAESYVYFFVEIVMETLLPIPGLAFFRFSTPSIWDVGKSTEVRARRTFGNHVCFNTCSIFAVREPRYHGRHGVPNLEDIGAPELIHFRCKTTYTFPEVAFEIYSPARPPTNTP